MKIDINSLEDGSIIDCDVVIIGGGMAGICMAKAFCGEDFTVGIFESGDEQYDDETQALNIGNGVILDPKGTKRDISSFICESRTRYYGGTGNEWGGKCATLEVGDFQERPWIVDSGWPITYFELEEYYRRSCYALQIPALNLSFSNLLKEHDDRPIIRYLTQFDFKTSLRCFSGVTGKSDGESFYQYKNSILNCKNVTLYKNAVATNINCNQPLTRVSSIDIRTLKRRSYKIKSKIFLLACGAIENARLLLNSSGQNRKGLGNDNDVLGRYFGGHAIYKDISDHGLQQCHIKSVNIDKNLTLYTDKDPQKMQGIFTLSRKAQLRERMTGFSATFESSQFVNNERHYPIFFMSEQYPNRECRISLANEHDFLGMRHIQLNWIYQQNDIDNVKKGVELFSIFVEQNKIGQFVGKNIRIVPHATIRHARHHMGGTRMHKKPEFGVVDENCKVHGLDNLYISGTSIFPTSGLANPTLTLMALALRLSDEVKRQFVSV